MPKKTKAVKITDENKAWNKKKKASKYNIDSKTVNKVILIVTEGLTEKLYFSNFRVLSMRLEIIDLQGQSKIKLIEATSDIVENTETDYDEVWCVFDMDFNQGEIEFANFDNAIAKAEKLGFKAAYSNDVFELWFYLHYQYTEQEHLRQFYYTFLSKQWNINYEKNGKSRSFSETIYEILEADENASQKEAIKNAEKLYQKQSDLTYHKQNPATRIYKLVELLNTTKQN